MSARPAHALFRPLLAVLAGFALLASAGSARAGILDPIYIGDSESPGMFTGSVQVTNQLPGSAVITITLTNTSPAANSGYITAFAFNDPGKFSKGNISGVQQFTAGYDPNTAQNFKLIGGSDFSDNISSSPYGYFDIGASVTDQALGGGGPSDGLAVGETGTFVFQVTGSGLNNLSAATLLDAESTKGIEGLFVRFRGFKNGDSDKDIAGIICDPPPPPPPSGVPAPPGVVLAGMGFGCLLLGRLRTRRPAAPPQA